ncbi:MAG: hypothetical protein LAN18_10435, partial [Acidobacteriia bacterium]|nr:hypothetical protein [Terriglobia bacterium]
AWRTLPARRSAKQSRAVSGKSMGETSAAFSFSLLVTGSVLRAIRHSPVKVFHVERRNHLGP